MINVQVKVTKRGEDDKGALDRALKRLKSKLDNEGVLDTVRAKRRFETPKQRKERKLRTAILKNKRKKQQISNKNLQQHEV
jgi:small subunit ribosomal protein S21